MYKKKKKKKTKDERLVGKMTHLDPGFSTDEAT